MNSVQGRLNPAVPPWHAVCGRHSVTMTLHLHTWHLYCWHFTCTHGTCTADTSLELMAFVLLTLHLHSWHFYYWHSTCTHGTLYCWPSTCTNGNLYCWHFTCPLGTLHRWYSNCTIGNLHCWHSMCTHATLHCHPRTIFRGQRMTGLIRWGRHQHKATATWRKYRNLVLRRCGNIRTGICFKAMPARWRHVSPQPSSQPLPLNTNHILSYSSKIFQIKRKLDEEFCSVLPYIRKSITVFEGSRAAPACPSQVLKWRWVWSNGGMILTGENWSTGRKTLYSAGGRWIDEYGAMVEWYWQGKTEVGRFHPFIGHKGP